METQLKYTSFNNKKTIEELLYNIMQYQQRLSLIDKELHFLKFLIEANIYKEQVMNLFETLTFFDKRIDTSVVDIKESQVELQTLVNTISNKIECEDLECDTFFIEMQDKLELKTYNLIATVNSFKDEVFQYLKSVIKNV